MKISNTKSAKRSLFKPACVFIIMLSVLAFSCLEQNKTVVERNVSYQEMNLGELFTYYVSLDDTTLMDTIERMMDDSISFYKGYEIISRTVLDSMNNMISEEFILNYTTFCYEIKSRNIFPIGPASLRHQNQLLPSQMNIRHEVCKRVKADREIIKKII